MSQLTKEEADERLWTKEGKELLAWLVAKYPDAWFFTESD